MCAPPHIKRVRAGSKEASQATCLWLSRSRARPMPSHACEGACCKRHPRQCTEPPASSGSERRGGASSAPPLEEIATASNLRLSSEVDPAWRPLLDARRARARARAGLIYVHLGAAWPPWTPFITRAAAANAPAVDFYFLGPRTSVWPCDNCLQLPLDADALLGRVARHLGLPRGSVELDDRGRKLCDMKPMWAALFPELTSRHEFIGYADQ